MNDAHIQDKPSRHAAIEAKSQEIDFSMPSDLYIGTLLKTLVAAKAGGNLLELGTGIGLSLSWMIDGMDASARLTTVDNDSKLIEIARHFFGDNERVEIVCADGAAWIHGYEGEPFDLVFADAWPGKYSQIEEILDLIKPGGMYVIDDMQPQPNWPEGHAEKAEALIAYLESRTDFSLTKLNWSTGVILMSKKV
jgi:predicted O-methyltransferase YrrM